MNFYINHTLKRIALDVTKWCISDNIEEVLDLIEDVAYVRFVSLISGEYTVSYEDLCIICPEYVVELERMNNQEYSDDEETLSDSDWNGWDTIGATCDV
jgi:hypothetical protein